MSPPFRCHHAAGANSHPARESADFPAPTFLSTHRDTPTEEDVTTFGRVAQVITMPIQHDPSRLRELVHWPADEYGPVTGDERAAATEELRKLDTEHEHRRTTGCPNV
jgi:hypothetical protein